MAAIEEYKRPFQEELVHFADSKFLWRLPSYPNLVIRAYRAYKGIEEFTEFQNHLALMEYRYHITSTPTRLVVGPDLSPDPLVYSISDFIEGPTLAQPLPKGDRVKKQVDQLGINLTYYYQSVYRNGGRFWDDIFPNQFVFGRSRNAPQTQEQIYLVDVGASMETFDPNKIPKKTTDFDPNSWFFYALRNMIEFVVGVERDALSNRMDQTRKDLTVFLKEISKSKAYGHEGHDCLKRLRST